MSTRYLPIPSCANCPFVVVRPSGTPFCTNSGVSKEHPRRTTFEDIPAWCPLPVLREAQ